MTRFQEMTPTRGQGPSHSPPDVRYAPGAALARKLAWFSIGLGAAELLVPDLISRATGVRNEKFLAICGVREIVCGIGILMTARPVGWMWAHVAGDAIDLAALGAVCLQGNAEEAERGLIAVGAVAAVTALDALAAAELTAAAAYEG